MSATTTTTIGGELVSVVIPTTGRRDLRRAVISVLAQHVRTEAIVVVDRLTAIDEVHALMAGLDCQIVTTSGGVGGSAARNVGIDHSHGAFIAFCDDDDWWEPEKLSRQLEAVAAAPDPGRAVVVCAMIFHRRDGRDEILPRRLPAPREAIGDYLVSRPQVHYGDGVIQTSCMMAGAALARATRWNETLHRHEDWDLAIRLIEDAGADLIYVSEPLAHVQQGSAGSLSARGNWRESRAWLELHGRQLSPTATADFLAVQVLRAAFACRDLRGVGYALLRMARRTPHRSALVVAGLGILGR